ncbi:lipopolysaccharide biosynthesis protein [Methylomonas sp. MK1]|uniref:lipopolysaccharide biosynthesis protein n=1 Tax=Methylomonas sp. MK1 TaxID=1131552 RepID=UPI000364683A|nr:oligosaccharide flippase family protein [Methylomonas sp. MK1]
MTDTVSSERTRNYLRQIKVSVIYKAVSMAASFCAIPLMIDYLGQEQFGVWSTLLTVMSWIVFFDLGIGNGLRNKVAEALANNDRLEAVHYISSGYSLIGVIALIVWAVVTSASFFIPWQMVFNSQAIPEETLLITVQISAFFILLNFWIGLISALLGAVQKSSLIALGPLISNILTLTLIFVLTKLTDASICNLAVVYGVSMVIANLILSFRFFQYNPELLPSFFWDKHHIRPLLSVGMQFFVIQLAVLVIFTTDKLLIIQLFGPEYVTEYEVVFKLFSMISFAHALVSAPLWSAYTEAYHRNDTSWIRSMLRKQLMVLLCTAVLVLILVFTAQFLVSVWISPELNVSFFLIIAMGLFVLISSWNNVFAMLVNGIGKIRVQLYAAIIAMLINIPLALFFTNQLGLGSYGVVLATCISLLFVGIALPIQVLYLIRNQIWVLR